ncbi:MAG: hypothetical protein U9P80_09265 [Thermodesulfobacteriota bacterium]|nr:hypothetical protein [Thermodesulfobacteriota bacterium]
MGDHHPEDQIGGYLLQWKKLCLEQVDALSRNELDIIEPIHRQSVSIQIRLDKCISKTGTKALRPRDMEVMKEILCLEQKLESELQTGSQLILEKIGQLRKNRSSIAGYKQPRTSARLLNKST